MNPYLTTEKALKECRKRIELLCGMVNDFSIELGRGHKVTPADWSDVAVDGLALLEKEKAGTP